MIRRHECSLPIHHGKSGTTPRVERNPRRNDLQRHKFVPKVVMVFATNWSKWQLSTLTEGQVPFRSIALLLARFPVTDSTLNVKPVNRND